MGMILKGGSDLKHFFVITTSPKGPSSGPNFWLDFEDPDPQETVWRTRPFSRENQPKNQNLKILISMIAWISFYQTNR